MGYLGLGPRIKHVLTLSLFETHLIIFSLVLESKIKYEFYGGILLPLYARYINIKSLFNIIMIICKIVACQHIYLVCRQYYVACQPNYTNVCWMLT